MDQSINFNNKLEFSEARFKAIAQTASDSIIISDENSIIVFANKKTYEIFGHDEGTLIGSDLGKLMPEKFRKRHQAGIQRFIATGNPKLIGHTVEIEGLRKNGLIFPLELSLSSWKEGESYFFSGIIRDVTERKEANIKLQNQQEELEAANEELKAAEEELRSINDDLEDRVEKRTKELAESERRVKRREEELRMITDAVPAMISYLKKDGTYGFVNKAYEEVFQINRGNIIGRHVKEIIGEKWYNNSLPLIEKALSGEFVESEVFQDFGPEVGKKWRRASFVPHQVGGNTIGTYVLVEDVTKLKNIQIEQEIAYQKLKEKDEFYKALIEHGSDFINVFDEKLNYLYSGGAILRELGYKPEQLVGEKAFNFVHPDDIPKVKESLSQALASQEPIKLSEIRFKNTKGEWRWLEATLSNQLNNPSVKGVVVSSRDITERKEAEEYQLEVTNELFMQNRDLQQFTYIVSHNLRSPVANIIGLAGLLTTTEDKGSETYEVSLGYLKRTANQLDTVLKDLNQILSIRDKKAASIKEKVELAPVIQQVLVTFQEPLNECGGKVFMKIEEGVSVSGNKGYLYSIFHNLLSNSIKYRSPDRHLEVHIKCFDSADKGTVISFSDNGLGFDMEKVRDSIFKLYKRFHTNHEGRGIGLFLVKTHVEALDGHIEVQSQVNVGTTFLINLK